ncbi:SAM-dependent methyltransferase [Stackebrandtia soli]|uniref:SAM-dependent methyltransferase n=1 Tax=Stackebrandtia soli TaxID=1892856 RepID=UPI0039E9618A
MTQDSEWTFEGVDTSAPNMARSYDYWLGGSHNFAVDREYARKILEVLPATRQIAQDNRAFMQRAIRFMMAEGVRQFLDLGSGIPTVGNVHEIAQGIDPATKVVYVDIDQIAVAHSEQILADNPYGMAIRNDLRNVDDILSNDRVRDLLDFGQPIGLLFVSVLHVISNEDDPRDIIARYGAALAPGSYLAISHGTADNLSKEMRAAQDLSKQTATPGTLRTRAEVEELFGEFDLVEPGLVWTSEWRPEEPDDLLDQIEPMGFYVGVGRKP